MIGELVATLLMDSGFAVTGYDFRERVICHSQPECSTAALTAALLGGDAVVSCVPYHLPLHIAEAAYAAGVDLTEDVPTTNWVYELASNDPKIVYGPHCGLAPGLIGIVGSWLAKDFESISIELKVGVLPRHPAGLLGYAFNWSRGQDLGRG
jgi:saccharopine dehydrogenase-like NADP-dependent oxidoreductase